MTPSDKQTIDYIAALTADLAKLAEASSHRPLGYILRMAEMEARRLLTDGPAVKEAA
jgi:hypothetical protein